MLTITAAFPAAAQTAPLDALRDSFGGASVDGALWTVAASGGTASEGGGTLNLVPDANDGAVAVLVSSVLTYSLTGSHAAVRAARVPNPGNVDVQYSLVRDSSNSVQWLWKAGYLYALSFKNGTRRQLAKLAWSATAHAWWRLRESGGTVFWETSKDGSVYTVRAQTAASNLFSLSALRVSFYLETFAGGLADPGQASFASFNVAPGGIPKISALVDTFGAVGTGSLWKVSEVQGAVSEDGSLMLAPDADTGSSHLTVRSARAYDLSGSSAQVEVREVVSAGGNVDQGFTMQIDASNSVEWRFASGTLSAVRTVNGLRATVAELAFDPVQHAFWRIRETSGAVSWETASDGVNWTSRASSPTETFFPLSALFVTLYANTSGTGSPAPGVARYANFNYARSLAVSGLPGAATPGVPLTFTVEVRDAFANRVASYAGTVSFSTTDAEATLPGPYTFTKTDQGAHTFASGMTFVTPGPQSWAVTDGKLAAAGTITVSDATPPQPTVTASPVVNGALSGTVTIFASAVDDVGVVRTEIWIDDALFMSAAGASASSPWDTTYAADGLHLIVAKAYDAAGNAGASAPLYSYVQNFMETRDFGVQISGPQNLMQGSSIQYTINTSTLRGAPQLLHLRADGYLLPAGVATQVVPDTVMSGESAVLIATAAQQSEPVTGYPRVIVSGVYSTHDAMSEVHVLDVTPPRVSLDEPAPGSTVSGAVFVVASATDNSLGWNPVRDVELDIDGAHFAGSIWDPASASGMWDTTTVADGLHGVVVRASDASGNVGSSYFGIYVRNSPSTRDFTALVSPTSASIGRGGWASFEIQTSTSIGAPQPLTLSASGLTEGLSAVFAPASITSGGTATLTVNAGAAAVSGTLSVLVTGVYRTQALPLALTIQGTPPGATISPSDGSLVSGTQRVEVTGLDHSGTGIATTEVRIDDVLLAQAQGPLVSADWDTTTASDAEHTLQARVTDNTGVAQTTSVKVTVQNSAATRDFTISVEPATLTVPLGGNGLVSATTAETLGSPETLQISLTGMPFFSSAMAYPMSVTAGATSWVSIYVPTYEFPGTYQVQVVAQGAYSTHAAPFTLVVADNIPPTVNIDPVNGSVVAGLAEINPGCMDNFRLASCDIFMDGVLVDSSVANPYFHWDSRTADDGLHTLQAVATDTAGLTATSTVIVQVANAPRAHDLVWNGSFEKEGYPQRFAQWNDSGSLSLSAVPPPYDGQRAATLSGGQWLSQVVWLPATPVTLSFWYQGALGAGATPSTSWQEMSVRDRAGATLAIPLHVTAASTEWQQVTADLGAWAGSPVELRFAASGLAKLYLDAVSLVVSPDDVGNPAPCLTGGNVILLDGSAGDWVHPGTEVPAGGVWSAIVVNDEVPGPRMVQISVHEPAYSWWWTTLFKMRPIEAGKIYEGATRGSWYGPGLDVSGSGRGCNQVAGRYAVQEMILDASGNLRRWTATFEQSCETSKPVLRGCVHWEAPQ